MQQNNQKAQVAALLEAWIRRAGFKKKQAATLAGLEYYGFHHAYFDLQRDLDLNPGLALKVLEVFTTNLPAAKRCTADEAIRFCLLVRLPIDRYEQLRAFFPAEAWQQAMRAHFPTLNRSQSPLTSLRSLPATDAPELPAAAALPTPHHMPLARNPLFQGRAEALQALAQLLCAPAQPNPIVAISGIGGMGKTNLATEFVYRFGQRFAGGVFWLNCANAHAMLPAVAACGGAGLVARDDWGRLALDEQVRLTQLAWQEPIVRLLIFDNCEEVEVLTKWRPTSGGCRVLLTCRRESWPRVLDVSTFVLRELPRPESVALLQRYRPDLQPNVAPLDALAAELGDLPLALHLAGSYLEANRLDPPFSDPATLLHELRAADPLDHAALQGVAIEASATEHEQHVARSLAVSLNRLRATDPADLLAQALLSRIGQLAPNAPFPREQLAPTLGIHPNDSAGLRLAAQALQRLALLGFIQTNEHMVIIHPLVAAFARRVGDREAACADVEQALLAWMEAAYINDDLAMLRILQPHFHRLTDAAIGRVDELAARLCNNLPFVLDAAGDVAGGIPYLERARAILERLDRLSSRLGAEVLNNLAEWYRGLNRLDLARACYDRALAIRHGILLPDDPDIAQSENNLAELLRQQGTYEQARVHYTRALAIWASALGPTHVYTLAARNNIGLLWYEQGEYAAAAAEFEAILAIVRANLDANDTRLARTQLNYGKVLRGLGDYERAQAQFAAALGIFRAKFGDEHYETLRPLHQLALLSAERGRLPKALHELRQLYAIGQQRLGPQHPFTQMAGADLRQLELGNDV